MSENTPAPTPHRAIYGFAFYLLFFMLFILYIQWALPIVELFGLRCLPDKYFALCLPTLVLVGMALFVFCIYPAINLSMTPNVNFLNSVKHNPNFNCANITNDGNRSCELSSEYCKLCKKIHKYTTQKRIALLEFIDLAELNNRLFK